MTETAAAFSTCTSFPLVHTPVEERASPKKKELWLMQRSSIAHMNQGKRPSPGRHVHMKQPQLLRCLQQRAEVTRRLEPKMPVPCLLPFNRFIAQNRRRDEEHFARSQIGLARAVARGKSEDMEELNLRMQPHVTLHCEAPEVPLLLIVEAAASNDTAVNHGQHLDLKGAVVEEFVTFLKSRAAREQHKMNAIIVQLQCRFRGRMTRLRVSKRKAQAKELQECLEGLEDAVLDAYWDSCHELKESYAHDIEAVPRRGYVRGLVRWLLDLPKQNETLSRKLGAMESALSGSEHAFLLGDTEVSLQQSRASKSEILAQQEEREAPYDDKIGLDTNGQKTPKVENTGNAEYGEPSEPAVLREMILSQQKRAGDFMQKGSDFEQLLGTWKWKRVCGDDHWPWWILPQSSQPARKDAASIWRAPPVSQHMPSGGRNLWRSERVSPLMQASLLRPRSITKDVLLHQSSAMAPPYPGPNYMWTPDSLRPGFGEDVVDCLHLWS